jgi:hypothetical protein
LTQAFHNVRAKEDVRENKRFIIPTKEEEKK